ncbi:hypothetical protein PMAYCL1PPCAC_21718 [Pristionchus mayeri]|uniref:Uncharacterized protein n=1 Tax=Pristionchus mayeri TaxID=1317129 RepID=A0AAN5I469_9BILA|nr:hypothetical protein PMAYCL1PPCAC_21718 [Pristionchus mayeri]
MNTIFNVIIYSLVLDGIIATAISENGASDGIIQTNHDNQKQPNMTVENPQSYTPLFPEVTGYRCLKSYHKRFLRGWGNETDWHVGTAPQCGKCEKWTIKEHDGKVSLKESCTGKYLRANLERYVDLADKVQSHELWEPVKNGDSTWKFKSFYGTWLRSQPHGRISLNTVAQGFESFTLESWAVLSRTAVDKSESAREAKTDCAVYVMVAVLFFSHLLNCVLIGAIICACRNVRKVSSNEEKQAASDFRVKGTGRDQ